MFAVCPKADLSVGAGAEVALNEKGLARNFYYNDGFVGTADERVAQDSYTTIDSSVTWRPNDGNIYVRAWGKNLADSFYRTQLSATNSGDNGTSGVPRTFGVTLGVDF